MTVLLPQPRQPLLRCQATAADGVPAICALGCQPQTLRFPGGDREPPPRRSGACTRRDGSVAGGCALDNGAGPPHDHRSERRRRSCARPRGASHVATPAPSPSSLRRGRPHACPDRRRLKIGLLPKLFGTRRGVRGFGWSKPAEAATPSGAHCLGGLSGRGSRARSPRASACAPARAGDAGAAPRTRSLRTVRPPSGRAA